MDAVFALPALVLNNAGIKQKSIYRSFPDEICGKFRNSAFLIWKFEKYIETVSLLNFVSNIPAGDIRPAAFSGIIPFFICKRGK